MDTVFCRARLQCAWDKRARPLLPQRPGVRLPVVSCRRPRPSDGLAAQGVMEGSRNGLRTEREEEEQDRRVVLRGGGANQGQPCRCAGGKLGAGWWRFWFVVVLILGISS